MYEDLINRLRTLSLYSDKFNLEIYDLCIEASMAIEHLSDHISFLYLERSNQIEKDG